MENYITRLEYEARHQELVNRVSELDKGMKEIKDKLDAIEIGGWKLVASTAIGFIAGTAGTIIAEVIIRHL